MEGGISMNLENRFENYFKQRELNQENVNQFITRNINSVNRCSYYTFINRVNNLLTEYDREDLKVDSREREYQRKCIREVVLLDRKDVIGICETFINYVDKFIVYGLFSGILGKEYSDLINIKVEDVSSDYKTIKLKDKTIECDVYMQYLLKNVIKEHNYDMNVRDTVYSICVYDYNMESPYLIKVKPTKRNRNGLNPITKVGIQIRLKKLTSQLHGTKYENVNLTGQILYKSHIIYKMHTIDTHWTIDKVRQFLKTNNYIGDTAEIRRLYFMRYRK